MSAVANITRPSEEKVTFKMLNIGDWFEDSVKNIFMKVEYHKYSLNVDTNAVSLNGYCYTFRPDDIVKQIHNVVLSGEVK